MAVGSNIFLIVVPWTSGEPYTPEGFHGALLYPTKLCSVINLTSSLLMYLYLILKSMGFGSTGQSSGLSIQIVKICDFIGIFCLISLTAM